MRIYKCQLLLSFILLSSFLFLTPAHVECQNNKVKLGQVPKWINIIPVDTAISSPLKDISDGYLTILSDKQINDSTHSGYYHFVRKILSESGIQNGSDISVSFNPAYQNLVFHSIKVIRNGKEINQLNLHSFTVIQAETDREENLYNGELSADYLLHDIRKGDIIEYAYSLNGENPIFNNKLYLDLEVEFSVPVDRIYYRVVLPKDGTVQIKYFKTDLRFKKGQKGNEYILDISNENSVKADEYLPSWYCAYGYVQFSQFSSWADYAQWATSVFKTTEPISAELSSKIKELRKANSADTDFVLACIRFVQDEIRYEGIEIGENNQRPYPPSQVFVQRFGDCKDKSLLLCTMLRTEGFTADPVLVNTSNKQVVADWLPSPSDFNHCIVKILLKGKVYWIDPTIALQRGTFGNLSFPDYKLGLIVNSTTRALDTIPQKINGRTESKEEYTLADTSAASQLTVVTKYYGIQADNIRRYFAGNSRTDIEKDYTNFYARSYPKISMADSIQYEDNEENNIIIITEKYTIEDLWERTDDGWKAHFAGDNIRSKITVPHSRIRKTPIGIDYPTDFIQTIAITPPITWAITNDDFSVNQDGFEYSYSRNYTDGVIHLNYQLKITKDFIGTEQLDTYFNNTKKILDNIGYSLLWHPNLKAAGIGSKDFAINWIMVFVVILFVFFIILVFNKIYKIDFNASAQRESSKPIGGWLVLVAIGLFFSPLRVLFWISTNNYFNLLQWNLLTNPGSSSYNSGLSALLVLELIGNLSLAATSIYLLILFFKKRTSFPKTIIAFYIYDFIFVLADYLGALGIGVRDSLDSEAWTHIMRSLVPAMVWIPYFLISERVKETFTRTYKQPSNEVTDSSTKTDEIL